MLHEQSAHADHLRLAMAIAMTVFGLAALARPRCFGGVAGYFTRWSAGLATPQRERLDRVVWAREDAEGLSAAYGRYLGLVSIALAGLEAVRSVAFVLPYALLCLAIAGVMLLAYLQFHRATALRVAPMVRRSPLSALPPLVIASVVCSFLVSLALTAYAPERFEAFAIAVSTAILGVIAWRVADAPALLLGVDPQYEYAVDERVRVGRARAIANLACAPALLLAVFVVPSLPAQYAVLESFAVPVVTLAFLISFAASIIPLRQRLRLA